MSRTEDFLGLRRGDMVAFTGGGGKSTLIFALARRLVKEGRRVLVAATRPFRLPEDEKAAVFLTEEQPLRYVPAHLGEHGLLVMAKRRLPDGTLLGHPAKAPSPLEETGDYLLVEAEDAGGASLPPPGGPRAVPDGATVVACVAGLDALGPRLDTAGMAARLLAPDGPLAVRPDLERRVLLLNKADRRPMREDGARVARAVFADWDFPTAAPKILLTSLRDFLRPWRPG